MSRITTLILQAFHRVRPIRSSHALLFVAVSGAIALGRLGPERGVTRTDESVLTIAVRPEARDTLCEPPTTLDREIALGVARLDGRRARLVTEDDPALLVEGLLTGRFDLVAAPLAMTPELSDRVAFSLVYAGGDEPLALAVRPDDDRLRHLTNAFLIARALVGPAGDFHTDDLAGIRARGELRLLTERGPASYFVHDGEARGFEYELMKAFADRHDLDLKVVVPPNPNDLQRWLWQGKGDVIASGLEIVPERRPEVAYTRPYQNSYLAVAVREEDDVRDLDDLRGRVVHVRQGSPEYGTMRELQQCDDDFELRAVPDSVGLEEMLARVEDGTWDVTVCDSEFLDMQRAAGLRLRSAFPVKLVRRAWAVRTDNPELRASLNDFLHDEYRGLRFNLLRQSYFEGGPMTASFRDEFRSDLSGRLSAYDDLIRRYASERDLDWRLVAAQICQESRFDHESVSGAGAFGLMQLMPATANELGVHDLEHDPETSIRAGTRYLKRLLDSFEPRIPLEARIRFALASYNAGRGHVSDARRLAAREGWSPDRWYGNVEKALLLLQQPEYYENARHGYCRAEETVQYVARIDQLYRTYVEEIPLEPRGPTASVPVVPVTDGRWSGIPKS